MYGEVGEVILMLGTGGWGCRGYSGWGWVVVQVGVSVRPGSRLMAMERSLDRCSLWVNVCVGGG